MAAAEGIAIDEDYVYFTDFSTSGTVQKVAKAGGTPITLATNQVMPAGIAVDSTSVYWVNVGNSGYAVPGTGSVMRLTPK